MIGIFNPKFAHPSQVILPEKAIQKELDKPVPFDEVDTTITSFLKQYGQPPHVDIDDDDSFLDSIVDEEGEISFEKVDAFLSKRYGLTLVDDNKTGDGDGVKPAPVTQQAGEEPKPEPVVEEVKKDGDSQLS